MTFEDFGNLFTLFCIIIGLLICLFKYIAQPKRGYFYLVIFFLAHFFSDYYWAVYVLIMHSDPNVSEVLAYSGWNIAYLFLFITVYHSRERKEHYFHPLMLLPIVTNVPLFFLYIQFGGILNNILQVGISTITMIFCIREIMYYSCHKKEGVQFPRLQFLVLLFLIFGYGMWTASCFDWENELSNPYLYFSILEYLITLFFGWGIEKDLENKEQLYIKINDAEFRLQTLLQTITSFVILGNCAGGYFIVNWKRATIHTTEGWEHLIEEKIISILFITSVVLILLVIFLMYAIAFYYKIKKKLRLEIDAAKLSKINFYFTVSITLVLMGFTVLYNTQLLYDSAVTGIYENCKNKVKTISTEIESHLTITQTTLQVTADSEDISRYLQGIDIEGKGYGMIINEDGFIVAHNDEALNGKNIADIYGNELLVNITASQDMFHFLMDDKKSTLFVSPILKNWYAVIVVTDAELLKSIYSQLAVNIMILLIAFALVAFFYYLGYRNEQKYGLKVEKMGIQMVSALATVIDAKDKYTSGHSQRVADYSVMIAKRMGKTKKDLRTIYSAGLLHDIGKIRVPENIINKPGKLEKEEMGAIRVHTVSGYDILIGINEDERISYGAKYHHERYDGKGYPNQLEGGNIPEIARIIAVADAYDAMASDRSYRKALSQDIIREEIENGRGTQFDPDIADIMLSIIDDDNEYNLRQKERERETILVIDDEQNIIQDVQRILEKLDRISVLGAKNEDEAFSILENTNIALILLDLKMPGINSFELYQKIRKNHDMPVILMTEDKSKETLQKIRELYIDDFITKPLNEAITREAVYGLVYRVEMGTDRDIQ